VEAFAQLPSMGLALRVNKLSTSVGACGEVVARRVAGDSFQSRWLLASIESA